MVFGIEPLVYRTPHGFGMQNKDVVLVTPTGSELLFRLRRHRQAARWCADMPVKTVAILGAGHGGHAAAADLSRRGYAVRLPGAQPGAPRSLCARAAASRRAASCRATSRSRTPRTDVAEADRRAPT